MGNTATNMNIPTVPQEGKNADAIRANLKKVKLPDGFKIDLYAIVPDARYMAVAPSTNMLFVGTRKTTVWGRDEPQQRRCRHRGQALRTVRSSSPTRTACASRRTASWSSPNRTASCTSRPPSTSMKARTSRSASSFPKAS